MARSFPTLWALVLFYISVSDAFCPTHQPHHTPTTLFSSTTTTPIDPKLAVKLFGRLAEKYILLDDSAGMCCYSACSDCEFRLPGGGYRMADQSAARPKWIPSYTKRTGVKEHTSVWSTVLFDDVDSISKDDFCQKVAAMKYTPPLGGPYVGASSGSLDDDDDTMAVAHLFAVLAKDKEELTMMDMSKRIKQLADGEEGLAWANFQAALQEG